jgi:hypothetical protein|tara:strand:- start:17660 stop:17821 length:162 start_codon:yes stop_codon:yes gene_type:complete
VVIIKNNKRYCDICKKEVKCKLLEYENNYNICNKHINKLGYYKTKIGDFRKSI